MSKVKEPRKWTLKADDNDEEISVLSMGKYQPQSGVEFIDVIEDLRALTKKYHKADRLLGAKELERELFGDEVKK